jgi:anti-sigma factor (TIGR02949 family)
MGPIDFYSCAQVVRLLGDFVDRELSPHEIEQVGRHLLECEKCAHEVRMEASTLRSIRTTVRRIQLPPGAEARVWKALARERRRRLRRERPATGAA